ncbi:TetR family transcriptional regulator [Nocardia sp. NPDC055053]
MDLDLKTMPSRPGSLTAVCALLESDGYDALQLRGVARIARVSLRTIYNRYPSREELILAALSDWVSTNIYSQSAPSCRGDTLAQALMRVQRYIFEPWERSPGLLKSYARARSAPGGQCLDTVGFEASTRCRDSPNGVHNFGISPSFHSPFVP